MNPHKQPLRQTSAAMDHPQALGGAYPDSTPSELSSDEEARLEHYVDVMMLPYAEAYACVMNDRPSAPAPHVSELEVASLHEPMAAISLARRAAVLIALADAYSVAARARGLRKAAATPVYLNDLSDRYRDVDELVVNTLAKAGSLRETEEAAVHELLQTESVMAAGIEVTDPATDALQLTYCLRQAYGVDQGAGKRRKALKQLHIPQSE